MNLDGFLKENAEVVSNQKVVISERFKDKDGKPLMFEIQPLTEKEVDALRKKSIKKVKARKGYKEEMDNSLFVSRMIVESVVFPDFKSEKLQSNYGVMGAEDLLETMLTAGEYSNLALKVQEVCGFNEDLEELVEDAKN